MGAPLDRVSTWAHTGDMETTTLAAQITKARETANISVKQLSETAGIPRTTLTRQLAGLSPFEVPQLVRVCDALGVSVVDVMIAVTQNP